MAEAPPPEMVIRRRFAVIAGKGGARLEHFPGRSWPKPYPSIRFRHSVSPHFSDILYSAGRKKEGKRRRDGSVVSVTFNESTVFTEMNVSNLKSEDRNKPVARGQPGTVATSPPQAVACSTAQAAAQAAVAAAQAIDIGAFSLSTFQVKRHAHVFFVFVRLITLLIFLFSILNFVCRYKKSRLIPGITLSVLFL